MTSPTTLTRDQAIAAVAVLVARFGASAPASRSGCWMRVGRSAGIALTSCARSDGSCRSGSRC